MRLQKRTLRAYTQDIQNTHKSQLQASGCELGSLVAVVWMYTINVIKVYFKLWGDI